jgi:hypothetical protein
VNSELQQELELVTSKPTAENQELQDISSSESKQLSVAQLIYSDNKVSFVFKFLINCLFFKFEIIIKIFDLGQNN